MDKNILTEKIENNKKRLENMKNKKANLEREIANLELKILNQQVALQNKVANEARKKDKEEVKEKTSSGEQTVLDL